MLPKKVHISFVRPGIMMLKVFLIYDVDIKNALDPFCYDPEATKQFYKNLYHNILNKKKELLSYLDELP